MKRVVATGKTVNEAVTSALVQLGVTHSEASIRVIREPVRGILGFIGGREAEVEVVVRESGETTGVTFLSELMTRMGVDAEIRVQRSTTAEPDVCELEVVCDESDLSAIIGRHGAVLDSMQYLVNIIANQEKGTFVKFRLDAGDYRARRRQGLERLAAEAASRAQRTKKPVLMDVMPAGDRKVVHTYLQDREDVVTSSEGVDPNRRVVVAPVEHAARVRR